MKSDAREVNLLAALVAECLCAGRSREEIQAAIAFLSLVCTNARSYL